MKVWQWRSFFCGTILFALVVSLVSLIVTGIFIGRATRNADATIYGETSRIHTSPFRHQIGAAGAPITLTLPNDLTPYLYKEYEVHSLTAQPHVIEIDAGALSTTWDGTHKKIVLGGAKADGFSFYVIDKQTVDVRNERNIAFV